MMELFKGYVPTKDKKCTMAFKGKDTKDLKTYDDVKNLKEFAGILNDDVILIDIDDYEQSELMMGIVEDLQLDCRVYQTTRGKHFLFKNTNVEKCKTHTKLACGIDSDIKLGSRTSYSILKFNDVERPIIWDIEDDGEYQDVPKWMHPIKTNMDFLTMSSGDGRNQALFNYILTLQSNDFSNDEARECLTVINKYILKEPLSDRELEVILRDDAFQKPVFYKGTTFLFDKFAYYLKNNNRIVKINNQLHMYHDGIYVDGYERIEAEMIKHISNLNRSKRSEVVSYLELLVGANTMSSPADMIAFKNGVYDMEHDEFIDFNPDIIITNKINWNYDSNAKSPLVDHVLDKLSCNDVNIRMLLEETIGYSFYRRNELRKMFILIGDKANGKSTYLDMLKTLLGDENTCALDIKEIGERFKTAELFRKLGNIGDDISDSFIPDSAIIKKVVSGDRINAERKGHDPFDFNPYVKLFASANNMPRIKDKTGAMLDRMIIIPFDAKFSVNDADYDPYIKYKLRKRENIEYLIQLGIRGLKRVLENRKFTTCERVQKELQEYEENNNPILGFFKEIGDEFIENQPTKDVYHKYTEYCIFNSFQPMSHIEFSKQIKHRYDMEIVDKRVNGKKHRVFRKVR